MTALAAKNKSRFDFESGHIIKSPCRDCRQVKNLPGCSRNCPLLFQLQTRLIDTISSSNRLSEYEDYSLSLSVCHDA
jgi:hypothetical protein